MISFVQSNDPISWIGYGFPIPASRKTLSPIPQIFLFAQLKMQKFFQRFVSHPHVSDVMKMVTETDANFWKVPGAKPRKSSCVFKRKRIRIEKAWMVVTFDFHHVSLWNMTIQNGSRFILKRNTGQPSTEWSFGELKRKSSAVSLNSCRKTT